MHDASPKGWPQSGQSGRRHSGKLFGLARKRSTDRPAMGVSPAGEIGTPTVGQGGGGWGSQLRGTPLPQEPVGASSPAVESSPAGSMTHGGQGGWGSQLRGAPPAQGPMAGSRPLAASIPGPGLSRLSPAMTEPAGGSSQAVAANPRVVPVGDPTPHHGSPDDSYAPASGGPTATRVLNTNPLVALSASRPAAEVSSAPPASSVQQQSPHSHAAAAAAPSQPPSHEALLPDGAAGSNSTQVPPQNQAFQLQPAFPAASSAAAPAHSIPSEQLLQSRSLQQPAAPTLAATAAPQVGTTPPLISVNSTPGQSLQRLPPPSFSSAATVNAETAGAEGANGLKPSPLLAPQQLQAFPLTSPSGSDASFLSAGSQLSPVDSPPQHTTFSHATSNGLPTQSGQIPPISSNQITDLPSNGIPTQPSQPQISHAHLSQHEIRSQIFSGNRAQDRMLDASSMGNGMDIGGSMDGLGMIHGHSSIRSPQYTLSPVSAPRRGRLGDQEPIELDTRDLAEGSSGATLASAGGIASSTLRSTLGRGSANGGGVEHLSHKHIQARPFFSQSFILIFREAKPFLGWCIFNRLGIWQRPGCSASELRRIDALDLQSL